MAQGIMPSLDVSQNARYLWAITAKYGFHPSKVDRVDNLRKGAEFDRRVREFMRGYLLLDRGADRTWNALKTVLYLNRKQKGRQPWPRERIVSNPDVNELTLVFACFFLFNSYYWREPTDHVLKVLKADVVVWLLKEFGYRLDSEHALNCPSQEWHEQSCWKMVVACNDLSQESAPDASEIEALIVSCEECPLRLKAAHF